MNKRKVAFTTLGCKVNMYDTEAMMEKFMKKDYIIVNFNDFADIYVINTCTVTNFGNKKSRQMIRRAKKQNPNAIVVATGCYAQVKPEEVEKIEGINIIIGTKDRNKIVEIVENYTPDKKVLNKVTNIMKEKEFEKLSIKSIKGKTRAYLKIQEGCNRFCTYCIIPYARGPVRSRIPEDIISEVKELSKNGFKEIVLTGIHVASYGIDLENMNLIKIIEMVHNIDGIERIRFSSIEPNIINTEFINKIKNLPKICDHFHLSLQSGCDKTLKNMNRHYNCEQYEKAVNNLRNSYPDAGLTTDIIIGFPDETDEDFIESCNFAKHIKLSKIHVFPYSRKLGTKAAEFKNQISNEVKNERTHKMIEISNNLNIQFLKSQKGKIKSVLFEENIGNNIYEGHTSNYITVYVKSSENIVNKIFNVEITNIIKEEIVEGIIKY